ncbi:hypothetical protein BD414DRAFT_168986 [Trametes punicea]|nr:hypothetical protein BD414DRAFT_168986 [Trametes punicea]
MREGGDDVYIRRGRCPKRDESKKGLSMAVVTTPGHRPHPSRPSSSSSCCSCSVCACSDSAARSGNRAHVRCGRSRSRSTGLVCWARARALPGWARRSIAGVARVLRVRLRLGRPAPPPHPRPLHRSRPPQPQSARSVPRPARCPPTTAAQPQPSFPPPATSSLLPSPPPHTPTNVRAFFLRYQPSSSSLLPSNASAISPGQHSATSRASVPVLRDPSDGVTASWTLGSQYTDAKAARMHKGI